MYLYIYVCLYVCMHMYACIIMHYLYMKCWSYTRHMVISDNFYPTSVDGRLTQMFNNVHSPSGDRRESGITL